MTPHRGWKVTGSRSDPGLACVAWKPATQGPEGVSSRSSRASESRCPVPSCSCSSHYDLTGFLWVFVFFFETKFTCREIYHSLVFSIFMEQHSLHPRLILEHHHPWGKKPQACWGAPPPPIPPQPPCPLLSAGPCLPGHRTPAPTPVRDRAMLRGTAAQCPVSLVGWWALGGSALWLLRSMLL